MKGILPRVSATEPQALEAGTVASMPSFFRSPDWAKLRGYRRSS